MEAALLAEAAALRDENGMTQDDLYVALRSLALELQAESEATGDADLSPLLLQARGLVTGRIGGGAWFPEGWIGSPPEGSIADSFIRQLEERHEARRSRSSS